MGSCLAVEVRERPALYYRRSGQPRPTLVRPKNKSAYSKYDDSSLYRPTFHTSFRGNNYRSPEDFRTFHTRDDDDYYNDQFRSPTQFRYPNERPFEPLPPPVPPPTPFYNNGDFRHNNSHDLGGYQAKPHDEIQVIDGPVETMPRWPCTDRRRRAMVVAPQPKLANGLKYYDDSDDDSWVDRRRERRYSDDSWVEVNRPLRRRNSLRRSRSRNNSRYYL
jgi:hypothetical protein